jgi:hypothetical protein
MNENTTKIHSEIALKIKGAKKAMFLNHRTGTPLDTAINGFLTRLRKELFEGVPDSNGGAVRMSNLKVEGDVSTYFINDVLSIRQDNTKVDPGWTSLANAVSVIAKSDIAPESLKRPVVDFLNSNLGDLWGNHLMVMPPIIQRIILDASIAEEVADDA